MKISVPSHRSDAAFYRPRGQSSRPSGSFTLIELLVVVAIILLLAGLLLPALSTARDKALSASCMSTHRMLALSYFFYSEDYDGGLLRLVGGPETEFYDKMAPYLAPTFRWIDPAEKKRNTATKAWWHYGIPCSNPSVTQRAWPAITNQGTNNTYTVKLHEIRAPFSTALFFCKLPQTVRPPNWYTGSLYTTYGNPDYTPWPLHAKKTMTWASRFDGSMRLYRWGELVSYSYYPNEVPAPPAGYTGLYRDTPRNYLWTGSTSGTYAGWLSE